MVSQAATRGVDAAARVFLRQATNPIILGPWIVSMILALTLWRRYRYGAWPSYTECFEVVINLAAIDSGVVIAVVFLLTDPPAVEALSPQLRVITGLITAIAILRFAIRRLQTLFFPPKALLRSSVDRCNRASTGAV